MSSLVQNAAEELSSNWGAQARDIILVPLGLTMRRVLQGSYRFYLLRHYLEC